MQGVNGLEITNIKIKKINNSNTRLVGTASITLNDNLVIHDIKIIQLEDRRILGFPQRELSNGSRVDIAHPITSDFRKYVEDCVFDMFDNSSDDE